MTADMINEMLREYDLIVAPFVHNERWWIRASAQIWNEVGPCLLVSDVCSALTFNQISDFEYAAKVIQKMCAKRASS